MNYYNEIKEKLIRSEIYDTVRNYSKDRNKVKVYFEIGKFLMMKNCPQCGQNCHGHITGN